MKNKFLLSLAVSIFLSFGAGLVLSSAELPSPFKILPQPQSVVLLGGQGLEYGLLQNLVIYGGSQDQ